MCPSLQFRFFILFLSAALMVACGAEPDDGCGVDAEGSALTARLVLTGADSIEATATTLLTGNLTLGELVRPLSTEWTQLSGPKGVLDPSIYTPAHSAHFLSGRAVGQVRIKAKVTDANGLCVSAEKAIAIKALEVPLLVFSDFNRNETGTLAVPMMNYPVSGDITVQWTQTAGPPVATTPYGSGTNYNGIVFTVPNDLTPLSFAVKLFDKGAYFGAGSITFTPVNRVPQARAYASPSAPYKHQQVTLFGGASTDPENDQLRYRWSQISGPAVEIIDADKMNASFIAPDRAVAARFKLEVTDPFGGLGLFNLVVITRNRLPVAQAGANLVAPEGRHIQLDGSASSDPDNDSLIYTWTQQSGPTVQLTDSSSAHPGFTAPESGQALTFSLQVHDGDDASQNFSTVIVAIKPDTLDLDADGDSVPDSFDVDADGDGLIEIFTLEQLYATQQRSFSGSGCAPHQCIGYELTSDLDFDSNQDGIVDTDDYQYAKHTDWSLYRGNGPFNFDGNGHSIRNFPGDITGLFGSFRDMSPDNLSGEATDYFIRNLNLHGTFYRINGSGALLKELELNHRKRLTIANVNIDMRILGSSAIGGFISYGQILNQSSLTIRDSTFNGQLGHDPELVTAGGGFIDYIYVESSMLAILSCTAHFDAQIDSHTGGLIGHAVISHSDLIIEDSVTSGTLIDLRSAASFGNIGGLVGYIYSNYGHDTLARYSIRNSASIINVFSQGIGVGGLIGKINAPSPLTSLLIERSFYAGQLSGIQQVGGLLGLAKIGTVDIMDSWIGGQASGSGQYYNTEHLSIGGVAGRMQLYGAHLNLSNTYSLAQVNGDSQIGALFGVVSNQNITPGVTLSIDRSYWARDSSNQSKAIGSQLGANIQDNAIGLEHAIDLSCPVHAGDTGCGGFPRLYEGWDLSIDKEGAPAWYFGNGNQFPGLQVAGRVYRPYFDVSTGLYSAVGE